MKVIWTRRSQLDSARIDSFYAATSPAAAERSGDLALRAGRFLGEHPEAGPVIDNDIRKWSVSGCPYLLLYRLTPHSVEILRVRHEREDWRVADE